MVATLDWIRLECTCGKIASVPGHYAGRRVRCSQCGLELRVSGSSSSAERVSRTGPRVRSRIRSSQLKSPTRNRPSTTLDPYAPPRARVESKPRRKRSRGANRDLQAEAHIRAIGVWQRISAVLLFVAAGLGLLAGGFQGAIMVFLFVGFGAFYWWLGSSLMNYRGWARIVIGIFTLLGVLGALAGLASELNLFSMVINGLSAAWQLATLWALFGARASQVFESGYRLDSRPVQWWVSPFFYLPILLTVLFVGFVFVTLSAML
ncbi:MAG: hypothetical protein JKY65_03420 [Planctomycetes bacterium]|nr:hypothetical protein [Planctomycetota bacterium]